MHSFKSFPPFFSIPSFLFVHIVLYVVFLFLYGPLPISTSPTSIMKRTGISRKSKVSIGHRYGPTTSSSTSLGPARREERLAAAKASRTAEIAGMLLLSDCLSDVLSMLQKSQSSNDKISWMPKNFSKALMGMMTVPWI